ncbi:putative GTP-binding protein [Spathaspora sp. JA1]|nr:putative GTP-binding protein [Spathaspora sp. JA1]
MLLDVAGLVPNAHLGRGLGNKFLGDLTEADCLIHIVDASGTTDSEGKATRGYDPLQDIEWLEDEIFRWILGNLMERWGSVVRRHVATKSSTLETLRQQLGGYSANKQLIGRALDLMPNLPPLQDWDNETIEKVVKSFMAVKFPTVLSLNKMDHPDADKNVSKIILKYPTSKAVLTSSITEVFLRKLAAQNYIKYDSGTEFIDTIDDLGPEAGLRELDDKLRNRIENIRDLVLYRFGSTGVVQLLQAAADLLDLIPVFPLERDIIDLKFERTIILRPGALLGERDKSKGKLNDWMVAIMKHTHGNFLSCLSHAIYGDELGKIAVMLANEKYDSSNGPIVNIYSGRDLTKLARELHRG